MISRLATQIIWRRSSLVTFPSVRCFGSTLPLWKDEVKKTTPKKKATPAVEDDENKKFISRDDMARTIAEAHDLTIAKSKRILDTLFDHIVENVSEKMPVRIGNFGTFSAHSVAAKKARNPQNGEPIDVPAKEKIRFKPFTAFKEAVQSKENHAA